MEPIIELFRANPAPWLIVLFLGIFYWAFRGRKRQGKDRDQSP